MRPNPFRYGAGSERGVVPAALVGSWLGLAAIVLWGVVGAAAGVAFPLTRFLGVTLGFADIVCGGVLMLNIRDSIDRTVGWLRGGGASMLSSRSSAYWRGQGLVLAFVGGVMVYRGLIP